MTRPTDRVLLRVPTADDAATWCALFDDAEVMRYIGDGERRDLAYYEGLVQRQQRLAETTGLCLFSVLVEEEVVGFTGIQPWSHDWGPLGMSETGWRLGRSYWGRGYATEAARSTVDRAHGSAVTHVIAMIQEGNAASFGVARALGMTTERVVLSPEGARVHQLGLTLKP
jgi:RimJ/RimL family protein N-acetyltransferase